MLGLFNFVFRHTHFFVGIIDSVNIGLQIYGSIWPLKKKFSIPGLPCFILLCRFLYSPVEQFLALFLWLGGR